MTHFVAGISAAVFIIFAISCGRLSQKATIEGAYVAECGWYVTGLLLGTLALLCVGG